MVSLAFILLSSLSTAIASPHGLAPRQLVNATVELDVPNVPTEGRQVVDAVFQSYSIEFSYMADYAGNFTYGFVATVLSTFLTFTETPTTSLSA
jgi:hypothetical protein